MRLIDADTLEKDLKSVALSNGTLINTNTMISLLDKYQTAYDINKVVEELNKAKDEIANENYCRSINEKEKCDGRNCFKCCAEYLIEIVKRGCVFDDVCEWKVKSNYYVTKCSHDTDVMYGLKQDFKFCPYCGKKIKVVE